VQEKRNALARHRIASLPDQDTTEISGTRGSREVRVDTEQIRADREQVLAARRPVRATM